jgi:hypothetical protein
MPEIKKLPFTVWGPKTVNISLHDTVVCVVLQPGGLPRAAMFTPDLFTPDPDGWQEAGFVSAGDIFRAWAQEMLRVVDAARDVDASLGNAKQRVRKALAMLDACEGAAPEPHVAPTPTRRKESTPNEPPWMPEVGEKVTNWLHGSPRAVLEVARVGKRVVTAEGGTWHRPMGTANDRLVNYGAASFGVIRPYQNGDEQRAQDRQAKEHVEIDAALAKIEADRAAKAQKGGA